MNFDNYELSDELRATLKKDYDADVLGLKNKNTDLIAREATAKSDLEQSRVDAEQLKHDTAKELATEKGSVADFKLALDNEKEAMTLLKLSFQEEKDGRTLSDAVANFSIVLVDDPAGRMYMQSLFSGAVEVKDGNLVSKDSSKSLEDLKQSLVSDKANAKYIKATVGSGADSRGSNGEFNTVKLPKDMNGQERIEFKQRDPAGFKQAFNL